MVIASPANVSNKTRHDPFGMLLVGRNWEGGSEYRFGFNGKENTDDIYGNDNAVDFGARLYDNRLGRWFSVDQLYKKYSWINPYAYNFNNPISYIDKDGQEPTRVLSGTIEDAIKYFRKNNLTDVSDIIAHLNAETKRVYKAGENESGVVRYVYTEDNGWVDLYHYFAVQVNGVIAMDAAEQIQEWSDKNSGYSYEDLPSNSFGARAKIWKRVEKVVGNKYKTTVKELKRGEELYEAVETQFKEAKATNPEHAPNWEQIPKVKTREPIPDGLSDEEETKALGTGNYVPQNRSSEPYNLSDFPAAPDSIEKTQPSKITNEEN